MIYCTGEMNLFLVLTGNIVPHNIMLLVSAFNQWGTASSHISRHLSHLTSLHPTYSHILTSLHLIFTSHDTSCTHTHTHSSPFTSLHFAPPVKKHLSFHLSPRFISPHSIFYSSHFLPHFSSPHLILLLICPHNFISHQTSSLLPTHITTKSSTSY